VIVTALALTTAGVVVGAGPASAKSIVYGGMSCTPGTTGLVSFADQGSGRYLVGFVTTDVAAWRVQFYADSTNLVTTYLTPGGVPSNGLNLTAAINNLPNGKHTFTVVAQDVTNGGSCSAFIPGKL
jgi:hypothetical protein